ncbi:hypothetical protein G8770_03840 [Aestuariicella hydrocarbonica]|uniref:Acyltransferase n=1 Tax=Pseudomaricurvus hydrocarbonicus TaxID=1470433 RepID=A0A9E5JTP4_9GAMM|nr:sulfotransferase [Aestuariicella hydrocarbonica]NHO64675.1 hypothetical protein [Aestuariicella hydrocarbonica]
MSLIKKIVHLTRLDVLLERCFSAGFGVYVKAHPDCYLHLKRQFEEHQSQQMQALEFSKGSGVSIHGSAELVYYRGLSLGNNVHIGEQAYLHALGGITIGDNTHIGRNVTILSSSHGHTDALPYDTQINLQAVQIGKNVSIESHVTILPGVTIGDGAIVKAGTLVTQDIANCRIITTAPVNVSTPRDSVHYQQLNDAEKWVGATGRLLSAQARSNYGLSADELGANLFFVLGTGRSGSTAFAKTLNGYGNITCQHEPKLPLVALSTQYAHHEISAEEAKNTLQKLYCDQRIYPHHLHGESDQKYSNLVALLHEVLPKAKFIWLLRNPVDTINSTYSRGWFSQQDLFPTSAQEDERRLPFKPLYSQFRVHADKVGVMSRDEWHRMSPFARNCWYWSYWNQLIEQQFTDLPEDQKLMLRLENLQERLDDVASFLKCGSLKNVRVKQSNQASYQLSTQAAWTDAMHREFQQLCQPSFQRWYS